MPEIATLDRAKLATIAGGATAREWGHDLMHMGAVNAGSYLAAAAAYGWTSIKLHGKFFIPPSSGWRTWAPLGASIVSSTLVGAGLNHVVP